MYKRQSRKRPLCPMQSAFRPDTFYILYLSSTPRIWREVIKRQTAYLLHGSFTLAPSLWTDRELRKYHCPLRMSLPTPIAIRLLPYRFNRSLLSEGLGAPTVAAIYASNVLDEWVFSCQFFGRFFLCPLTIRIKKGPNIRFSEKVFQKFF